MGINKLFTLILVLFILAICLVFTVNTVILFQTKSDITRLEQMVITYAHSNGGFVDTDTSFNVFLHKGIKDLGLDGKIDAVKLSHTMNERVQKGTEVFIEVTPNYELMIPFSDHKIKVQGKPIRRTGVTRIYFKDL